MKKVVMILLSVILLVSCAKQTTITTEQTDLTTETLTQTEGGTTEPSAEVTKPSEAPTEEVSEAPSEEDTTTATEPDEPISTPKEGIYADLEKINIPVIGEFATIEDAFAGYDLQNFPNTQSSTPSYYEDEHEVGHRAAFYVANRTDMGYLAEVVDANGDGVKKLMVDQLYAFNKLYDVDYDNDKNWLFIFATDDVVTIIDGRKVQFIYSDAEYLLYQDPQSVKDGFTYSAGMRDGELCYYRARYVTHMQSFYDWAKEYWYPGYGEELALEIGTLTHVNGELIFTPDETYTVEEWLMVYAHMEEKLQESGYGTLDEYMDSYLYGELNPYKKS